MFGIIDENKKFILLDSDREKLRFTALMTNKEIEVIVPEYDQDFNEIGQRKEQRFVPMFTEETVDEAIVEYADSDIEKAYTGECYLAGYAPQQPVEEKNAQAKETRANLYAELIDPLHAEKQRKVVLGTWTEANEAEYIAEVKRQTLIIQTDNPYIE